MSDTAALGKAVYEERVGSWIGVKERHIDRLFAEEIEASADFAAWFAGRVFGSRLPTGRPTSRGAAVGYHRLSGETDIRVQLDWLCGTRAVLHVEDKLDAPPQPEQGRRYQEAVAAEGTPLAASVIFAPNAWVRRHPGEAACYDAAVAHEDAAEWIQNRAQSLAKESDSRLTVELAARLSWRADLLSGAARRSEVMNAIHAGDLTDWNAAAAEVIRASNGLSLQVRPRQRTTGIPKRDRFIRFDGALTPWSGGRQVILKLKTGHEKRPGMVSLEIAGAAGDPELRAAGERAGFHVEDSKRGGSLIVSASGPQLGTLRVMRPVRDQVPAIKEAADCAQLLAEWWEQLVMRMPVL